MDMLKAEQVTGSKWRVLAIPFSGPYKGGKDSDAEFFDRDTDIKPHWFKARPVLFHHGLDQAAKDEDYGEQELDGNPDDDGWWGTVWLNRSARYWAQVDAMLRAGKMYGSSGAIAHLVRKDHTSGHIEVWPHAEQTLTPTPANPYARITPAKAMAGFTTAGIDLDESVKSFLLDADDLRSDLSTGGNPSGALSDGGDDVAMTRRALALGRVLRLERRASSI
jgi:hypothetical protein